MYNEMGDKRWEAYLSNRNELPLTARGGIKDSLQNWCRVCRVEFKARAPAHKGGKKSDEAENKREHVRALPSIVQELRMYLQEDENSERSDALRTIETTVVGAVDCATSALL